MKMKLFRNKFNQLRTDYYKAGAVFGNLLQRKNEFVNSDAIAIPRPVRMGLAVGGTFLAYAGLKTVFLGAVDGNEMSMVNDLFGVQTAYADELPQETINVVDTNVSSEDSELNNENLYSAAVTSVNEVSPVNNDVSTVNTNSEVIDGNTVEYDEGTMLNVEQLTDEELTTIVNDINNVEVVDMSNIGEGQNLNVGVGEEKEFIFPNVETEDTTRVMVVTNPDGSTYVVTTDQWDFSADGVKELFAQMKEEGKITSNPFESTVDGYNAWDNITMLPGIKDEGSSYETNLGTFNFWKDEDGNAHMYIENNQTDLVVVDTVNGLDKQMHADPETTEPYKPVEPTPQPDPTPDPEPTPQITPSSDGPQTSAKSAVVPIALAALGISSLKELKSFVKACNPTPGLYGSNEELEPLVYTKTK